MFLLSRLEVASSVWFAAAGALVLGLGLGMVMQVLILAVQNAVDPSMMGVATSGSTLFRQIGGSIGVALFGTIFANRLHTELATRLPAGIKPPSATSPAAIAHLPEAGRSAFEAAFAAALHPVFLTAAARLCSPSGSPGSCAKCRSRRARTPQTRSRRCATSGPRSKPLTDERGARSARGDVLGQVLDLVVLLLAT